MLPERKWVIDAASLNAPLRSRKPYRWALGGDLFHEGVPDDVLDQVFAVMALAHWHTFQVLTKRSDRMRAYLTGGWAARVKQITDDMADAGEIDGDHVIIRLPKALRNIWLGVSVEDQRRADERIPDLLATPAAVRWISAEPLLGPVDLGAAWHGESALDAECWGDCAWCKNGKPPLHNCQHGKGDWEKGRSGLDWVVVGGESGPGARPMHPDWARSLRDQCAAAGVPFHFKQQGAWADLGSEEQPAGAFGEFIGDRWAADQISEQGGTTPMHRVGKKAAGRLLDGVQHDGFPEVRA